MCFLPERLGSLDFKAEFFNRWYDVFSNHHVEAFRLEHASFKARVVYRDNWWMVDYIVKWNSA